jgi:hypothetical protein
VICSGGTRHPSMCRVSGGQVPPLTLIVKLRVSGVRVSTGYLTKKSVVGSGGKLVCKGLAPVRPEQIPDRQISRCFPSVFVIVVVIVKPQSQNSLNTQDFGTIQIISRSY